MNAALTRLLSLKRARLQRMEQDLAFMEHHAPAALDRQRAAVVRMRRAIDTRSSEQVRRDIERAAKREVLQ
ncbi:MAG: hypothetical protein Q7J47_03215 [Azoarcus sp.]|nr:hypothetical protein [Azoarcus sp.]